MNLPFCPHLFAERYIKTSFNSLESKDCMPYLSPKKSIVRHALLDAIDSICEDCTTMQPASSSPSWGNDELVSTSSLMKELLAFMQTPQQTNIAPVTGDDGEASLITIGTEEEGPLAFCLEQLLLRQAYLHMTVTDPSTITMPSAPVDPENTFSSDTCLANLSREVFVRPLSAARRMVEVQPPVGCNPKEELPMKWVLAIAGSLSTTC